MKPIALLLLISSSAWADVQTNYVPAVPWFREVNGKLYNTKLSLLWENKTGSVWAVTDSGVVINTDSDKYVFLTNYPNLERAADGQKVTMRAMRVGVYQWRTYTFESWDCGQTHYVPIVVTNSAPASAKGSSRP
jgi:hypothetical protein